MDKLELICFQKKPRSRLHIWSVCKVGENPSQYFRLAVSRNTHSAMMRAALLRKIGYYVPSPKFYKNLKVFFKNEKEKNLFFRKCPSKFDI